MHMCYIIKGFYALVHMHQSSIIVCVCECACGVLYVSVMCVAIYLCLVNEQLFEFDYYLLWSALCSGQIIRIWGRPPFAPGGQVPPPLRPGEPFWQALFKQPQQVHVFCTCTTNCSCSVRLHNPLIYTCTCTLTT